MLLYCPECQNLVDKVEETKEEGAIIYRKCEKCGKFVSFYIKYKACSKIEA